jgi:hypothetical protein
MNIEQTIRNHSFFAAETGRVIESVKIEELMINVKYKELNDEISSTVCALRAPFRADKAKKPAYVLAIALGCVVKLVVDENQLNIKVAPTNDDENIDLNFEGDLAEDVFFQQSLVYDFRTVTHDHISFLNEMVGIVAEYEASL